MSRKNSNPVVNPGRHAFSFADPDYLNQVIGYLKDAREKRGTDISELSVRAQVRQSVIKKAERDGVIPNCRDFKAWADALGLSWNQLWRECLPGNKSSR